MRGSRPALSFPFTPGLLAPILLLAFGATVALAYVVPSPKLLEKWSRERARGGAGGAWELSVRWNGAPARVFLGSSGFAAFAFSSGSPEPAGGTADGPSASVLEALSAAWGLFGSRSADDLAETLSAQGFDLGRSGYARMAESSDGVAYVLGARGEGEPDLRQIWFSRQPLWPRRVIFSGVGTVRVGPPGPGRWPSRLEIDSDALELLAPPTPVRGPPSWVPTRPEPGDAGDAIPDWRRAFAPLEP